MELFWNSEDIWGKIDSLDPYQKRFGDVDKNRWLFMGKNEWGQNMEYNSIFMNTNLHIIYDISLEIV